MLLRCIVVTGKTSVGRLTSLTAHIIAADLTGTVFYVTRHQSPARQRREQSIYQETHHLRHLSHSIVVSEKYLRARVSDNYPPSC